MISNKKRESPPMKGNSHSQNVYGNIDAQPHKLNPTLQAQVMYKRAHEILKAEPFLSQNQLRNKLKSEGIPAGHTNLGRIYQKHRRDLSGRV